MVNRVTLVGRLGTDVELRYTAKSGTPVTKLRVATDSAYRDAGGERVETTEWHTVVAYGRSAENCAAYIGKGSLVYVDGSLRTRKWVDQDGVERYVTEVIARRIHFLDRRRPADGQDALPTPPESVLADTSTPDDYGINDMRD